MRLKLEIKPRAVLKFQTPLLAVALSTHDDERSHEADHVEVLAQLIGGPDLSALRFKCFSGAGLGVDFGKVCLIRLKHIRPRFVPKAITP